MFNDEDDVSAYEDELYREESSSDEGIDSEVESYLYSQVHYSQNLSENNNKLDDQLKDDDASEGMDSLKTNSHKQSVIVISDSDVRASDSSAVIILSDSFEEDSIYRSKSKGKVLSAVQRPVNQSTPKVTPGGKRLSKLQSTRSPSSTKSYKDGIVQEVLVIRGSSEEEEDVEVNEQVCVTSDTDQSDVENWMLLGREREDGDTSIQLNLKGYRCATSEDNNEVDWSVTARDSEAQIKNFTPLRRSRNRYYTEDKNVICRNCNHRGHLSKNCPEPKKLPACCLCGGRGHLQYSCSAPYCSNCFMPGHFHQDCIERPYWLKKCHRCSMIGHYADACPQIWRQYHLTVVPGPMKKSDSASSPKTTVYCCNCGRKGHCGYECNQRRMYSTVYPNCELVFTYDPNHEIWKRNRRAKRKFKELQDSGLVTLEGQESSHLQDSVDKLPNKKRKKNKKYKKQKTAEDPFAISSRRIFKNQKKKKFIPYEEYFPRGKTEKPKKVRIAHKRKNSNHLLFKDSCKSEGLAGQLSEGKTKQRKRKSSAVDESLLVIKQRRKKSRTIK